MSNTKMNASHDLYAEVQQSASDKMMSSVTYPFTVFDERRSFTGCSKKAVKLAAGDGAGFYEYKPVEIKKLFTDSVDAVSKPHRTFDATIHDEIYSFGGGIVEQAKKVIDAAKAAGDQYEGPEVVELQAVVDGGIKGLVDTLGDFGAYAWCPRLTVVVRSAPRIGLSSPSINLNGIKINVTATGELWIKYPWWNCYKWCTKWKKVIKCNRVASITVSPDIKVEAHAKLQAGGTKVHATGYVDKLRLDYDILDKIPLEVLANSALGSKLVFVYDAAELVATVPVLESRFSVGKIDLPPNPTGIGVGVVLKQV